MLSILSDLTRRVLAQSVLSPCLALLYTMVRRKSEVEVGSLQFSAPGMVLLEVEKEGCGGGVVLVFESLLSS